METANRIVCRSHLKLSPMTLKQEAELARQCAVERGISWWKISMRSDWRGHGL